MIIITFFGDRSLVVVLLILTWLFFVSRQMNRFKKRKYSKTHNLLTGETEASDEEVLVILYIL